MVFNSRGAIHKQPTKPSEAVETIQADIESPDVVEAPVEAPKSEPKKSGSKKKAKSKD